MTDIIKMLNDEDQMSFVIEADSELDEMLIDNEIPFKITAKIADLNATNILLIKVEDELRKTKIDQEWKILNLKNSETYVKNYKTLKQREETAKLETKDITDKIIKLENKVQILKSNKQGLEYELRLLFKMLEVEDCFDGTR